VVLKAEQAKWVKRKRAIANIGWLHLDVMAKVKAAADKAEAEAQARAARIKAQSLQHAHQRGFARINDNNIWTLKGALASNPYARETDEFIAYAAGCFEGDAIRRALMQDRFVDVIGRAFENYFNAMSHRRRRSRERVRGGAPKKGARKVAGRTEAVVSGGAA